MPEENYNIELDLKFIENFFGLADRPVPEIVSLDEMNGVLNQIKEKINTAVLSDIKPATKEVGIESSDEVVKDINEPNRVRRVLVVDDLGIVIFQLEILFKKLGYEVVVCKEINEAIEEFKKQDFGYVVMDLFLPTEREGFLLLDEIKKLSLLCKLDTKIITMTASSKPEHKANCLNRGADRFVEKITGWQEEIATIVRSL